MRSSTVSASTALPQYSTTIPRAPRAEILRKTVSTRSLAVDPSGSFPVSVMRIVPAVR
ncbi:unknown [Sutterella sp. CAG:397]|nr:unknown [Sutterella sp. CAG:397]